MANKKEESGILVVTSDELILIHEMIVGGSFSGKGVETVVSLKEKTVDELKERGLIQS